MSDFKLRSCPYCGGMLEHKTGNMWSCPYCGKECVQTEEALPSRYNGSAEEEAPGTTVQIQAPKRSMYVEFENKMVLIASIRGRVTMADKFPMELKADVDGREMAVAEELENIGKGEMTISRRGPNTEFYSKGKVRVLLNGKEVSHGFLRPGDRLTLGSVVVSMD